MLMPAIGHTIADAVPIRSNSLPESGKGPGIEYRDVTAAVVASPRSARIPAHRNVQPLEPFERNVVRTA